MSENPPPALQSVQRSSILSEVEQLSSLRLGELRNRWQSAFGKMVPKAHSRDLLICTLAWRIQEKPFGGHARATAKLLEANPQCPSFLCPFREGGHRREGPRQGRRLQAQGQRMIVPRGRVPQMGIFDHRPRDRYLMPSHGEGCAMASVENGECPDTRRKKAAIVRASEERNPGKRGFLPNWGTGGRGFKSRRSDQ